MIYTPHELIEIARATAESGSYSPYSKFRVGCSLIAGGRLYTGANIESASFGLTVCSERCAMFTAIAAGERKIQLLAVTCLDAEEDCPSHYRMPCGACRQVMAEFFDKDAICIVDKVGQYSIDELLPMPFVLTS